MADTPTDNEERFVFSWRHGPAPGLTYYSGRIASYGPDADTAMARARQAVCDRGCFSPSCITIWRDQDAG
jgi:hypothetical protein